MTREIELTAVVDEYLTKTQGLHIDAFTTDLGIWQDKSEEKRLELFIRWVDKSKYDTSYVWYGRKKWKLIFRVGYTISDQINSIMNELAGEGENDVMISLYEVFSRMKSNYPYSVSGTGERNGLWRTIFHNLDTKWLPTNEDQTYWTQYLAKDNEDSTYSNFIWPSLPSAQSRIYKAGFDPNNVDG